MEQTVKLKPNLSLRQKEVLNIIRAYQREHGFPPTTYELAEVHIVLYPPDQRRRDIDNYNKALFDALTQTGVWEDDSQVRRMLVEWGPLTKKGKVEITIKRFVAPAVAAA